MGFLPAELLQTVCSLLTTSEDIRNFRLVDASFAFAGEPYLVNT